MTNNEKFELLLKKHNLSITHYIRYVYLLENEQNEILFIQKTQKSNETTLYLGWQIFSETYWGCDWDDEDILDLAKGVIQQFTELSLNVSDIKLVHLDKDTNPHEILHIVYYVKFTDTSNFEFWYEFDKEAVWLKKDNALELLDFSIDKAIINLNHTNLQNLL